MPGTRPFLPPRVQLSWLPYTRTAGRETTAYGGTGYVVTGSSRIRGLGPPAPATGIRRRSTSNRSRSFDPLFDPAGIGLLHSWAVDRNIEPLAEAGDPAPRWLALWLRAA